MEYARFFAGQETSVEGPQESISMATLAITKLLRSSAHEMRNADERFLMIERSIIGKKGLRCLQGLMLCYIWTLVMLVCLACTVSRTQLN